MLCVRCRSWLQKTDAWVLPALLRGCRSGRLTATSRFAWPSSQKEASSEAGSQKSLQTVCWRQPGQDMNYWNHVLWSDESKVNLFDSDGVQHVWWCPGEEYQENCACLQSSMVVVASWSGAAWLLLVLGSCGSLRETWIPTCTVTFWSRRWCPPFRNCAERQFSNIIMTPNTPPRWQLPCCEADGEGDGVAKYVSRPESYWAHVGHPQAEGGEALCV